MLASMAFWRTRRGRALLLGLLLVQPGCATTHAPLGHRRGELVLRYDGGFELWTWDSAQALQPLKPETASQEQPDRCAQEQRLQQTQQADDRWRLVARAPLYSGLAEYVACSQPHALSHARQAKSWGRTGLALSIVGAGLGVLGAASLFGFLDRQHQWSWVGAGLGSATLGVTFSVLGIRPKILANGHAIDSMNFYNDSVGSFGSHCFCFRYPEATPSPSPAAPAPAVDQSVSR